MKKIILYLLAIISFHSVTHAIGGTSEAFCKDNGLTALPVTTNASDTAAFGDLELKAQIQSRLCTFGGPTFEMQSLVLAFSSPKEKQLEGKVELDVAIAYIDENNIPDVETAESTRHTIGASNTLHDNKEILSSLQKGHVVKVYGRARGKSIRGKYEISLFGN